MSVIVRVDLLKSLEVVEAGLSAKDIVEQSSCYIFQSGRVWTYNDDVACSVELPSGMDNLECAVPAVEFRTLLSKMKDEQLDVSLSSDKGDDGQLLLKTKTRRAGIRVQVEVKLPVSEITMPDKWVKLPKGLKEAVSTVQGCVGKGDQLFVLGCIHLTPKGLEACDNYQAIRYRLKTGLQFPVLVKSVELGSIVKLKLEEWGLSESWLHFRNSDGLMVSCRRWDQTYPKLSEFFKVDGEETGLPKSLTDAVAKAEVFVDSKQDVSGLSVDLKGSRLLLRGEGPLGWYEERQKVDYQGKRLQFNIAPRLLREVCQRSDRCLVGKDKLRVTGDSFVYVTCLAVDDEEE